MKKVFELRRDRSEKITEARSVIDAAILATRDLTDDERAKIKKIEAEAEAISRQIELFELRDSFGTDGADATGRLDGGTRRTGLPDLDGRTPYSLIRAMRMSLEERGRFDGLEGEVHAELLRTKPAGSEVRGILVPWSLANPSLAERVERRDVTTTTAAGSIAAILGMPLIDYLRNRMVMQAMGARVLTGLEGGTFSLPKQTGAETAYHVSEGNSPTASALALGVVTWTPRTIAAQSAVTRKTLIQTSLDVEMLMRQSIVAQIAREFDRVGVNGSGTGSIPLGIMQDPNVPTVAIGTNGGAPTWAMVCNLEKTVAQSNADFGTLGYITSNAGRSKMKQTTKITSSQYSDFLWQNDQMGMGTVNGYKALASEQVPSTLTKGSLSGTATALIFGNFDSATYGLWSGVDILVDPYTAGSSGGIKVYCFQDYDFQMRYEVGFAKCVDIDPS